jgi:hypothetical protein
MNNAIEKSQEKPVETFSVHNDYKLDVEKYDV